MKRVFAVVIVVVYTSAGFASMQAEVTFQAQSWQNAGLSNEQTLEVVSAISAISFVVKKIFDPNSYRRSNPKQVPVSQENKCSPYVDLEAVKTKSDAQIERELDLMPGPGTRLEKWNRLVEDRKRAQKEWEKRELENRKLQEFQGYCDQQEVYFKSRKEKRIAAIHELQTGTIRQETVSYALDYGTRRALTINNIDPNKFVTCTGNQLQQFIHYDTVAALHAANHEYAQRAAHQGNQTLFKTILFFAQAGCDYNSANDVLKASLLADWCWGAVKVLQKTGEGIACGVIKTVGIASASVQGVGYGIANTGAMLIHPKDTYNNLSVAVKELAACSANVIAHVAHIDYYLEHDSVEGHAYFKQFSDTVINVSQVLKQQVEQATIEGVACKTTTMMTEGFLQCKVMHQVGVLFSAAFTKAQKLVTAANELLPATEVLVATAEGIEVAIAQETLPLLKNEIAQGVEKGIEKVLASEIIETSVQSSINTAKKIEVAIVNNSMTPIFKEGYYEVNGFKFTEYYFKKAYRTGRPVPGLFAKEILESAIKVIPDPEGKEGFFKYFTEKCEMVYNPTTKEVWHIQQIY